MGRLGWVLLPLALFAAWVGARRLRGRPLSRHAVNVLESALLLVYFVVTAGLGVFWVANQQLPVFDLHYLFGYATLLLVAAHLAFNWRILRAYFTRGAGRARGRPPAARAPRPRRLGAAAACALAGLAGLLVGRWGLSGPAAPWPVAARRAPVAAGLPMQEPAPSTAVVERYHALSAHDRRGIFARAPSVDWGSPPPPFKAYEGRPEVPLPRPRADATPQAPLSAVLAGTCCAPAAPLDLAALGTILQHAVGVTLGRGGLALRAAPSSGALFPTELYVAARAVAALPAGLYHYAPAGHRLVRVGALPEAAGSLGAVEADRAPVTVLATAIFRRTGHKYRDRAFRYAVADAGHALENLRIASAALGVAAAPLRRFDEARAAAALGVDEAEEGVLAIVPLGLPPGEAAWRPPDEALAGGRPALGATALVHLATSLRGGAPPPAVALPTGAVGPRVALPPPRPSPGAALATIAGRRSVRRFAAAPLPLAGLSGLLHHAARPPAGLSEALWIGVVAHAVEGLAPGAYLYDPTAHALVAARRGALREAAAAAALDQRVVGDGAVAIVIGAEPDRIFRGDPRDHGARGYRHAFLETGMIGERLYLEAGARGLGACGVGAFYDDEGARLFGLDPGGAWPLHFVAIGGRPGG